MHTTGTTGRTTGAHHQHRGPGAGPASWTRRDQMRNGLKLERKDTAPDGWSRKPYQIARLGKLSFRLRPPTRSANRATIAVSHDDARNA